MINKSLVKKRFSKSLKTYDENALIQKKMAQKLVLILPSVQYDSVFETGCATGILTKEIKSRLIFKKFIANDIVEESKKYIDKIVPDNRFLSGDIEEIQIDEKFDLIISNACLQWCNDIEQIIQKLLNSLNKNGILAISIFGDDNVKEIKNIFDIKGNNYTLSDLKQFLSRYNVVKFEEEKSILSFQAPVDVLKHLKLTGVNALKEVKLTKSRLKTFEEKYTELYSDNNSVILTYNPVYIVIRK